MCSKQLFDRNTSTYAYLLADSERAEARRSLSIRSKNTSTATSG